MTRFLTRLALVALVPAVLGLHSTDPVGAQVGEIEAVQTTAVNAAVGSVATNGTGGVNRVDTVTYAPAGWNHVRGSWAFTAAANALDANFVVNGSAVNQPLIILSNYTAAGFPSAVRLNGLTLPLDDGYLPSIRAGSNELWITLNRTLAAGLTHRLEVVP